MKTVGHFQLHEKLGAGGMGVVYKAHDTRLERIVALKFLTPELLEVPTARERQLREARAAAALNHPNIATIYEIGKSDEGDFIAMEFVDGEQLYKRVRGKQNTSAVALTWAVQLCDAIAAAHDRGIVHRDIKSLNVMITTDGQVKVLDFGVARQEGQFNDTPRSTDKLRITDTGDIIGTVYYVAPEVLRGGDATVRSDVFSLGVVLHEMLTGQLPFEGPAAAQVMYSILNEDPPSLSERGYEGPAEVDAVVRRALAKDPSNRFASAHELAAALRSVAGVADPPGASPLLMTTMVDARPSARSSLPVPTTRFIGRESELAELAERLEENRMLTITGPGGAGKTRISIELATRLQDRFVDGVFLVELAPLTESVQVTQAIARVLGVREESGRDLAETLNEYVSSRTMLILLDNCEHLVEAATTSATTFLESAPGLKIVATSQHRLSIAGEVVWQISALSLPSAEATSVEELSGYEAVQLFVDRATNVKSNFVLSPLEASAVGQICRRLDGIPLAIELAAARVRVLPPAKILNRLEDRFKLLTGGSRTALPRQQTLRATVEWSLDLLNDSERHLFRNLSVFLGGMTLEAVEAVCLATSDGDVLDLVERLADKSLVLARDEPDGETRYYLLQTLRVYGAELLKDSSEEDVVRGRHARFYRDLTEQAETKLTGPDQARWFNRLDQEADNVRSAILWLFSNGEPKKALRIGGAIWRFWSVRGYLGMGRELLSVMLSASSDADETRAQALHGAGVLANDQGDYEAARAQFEECLTIRRKLGDRRGVAETLNSLGVAARNQGDYATARGYLEESLAINRDMSDQEGVARAIHALGIVAHREGDCESARTHFEEGLSIRKHLGDRRGIGALLAHLGSVAYDLGGYEEAQPLLEEGLAIFRELKNKRGVVFARMHLGGVAQRRGDYEAAREHFEYCLTTSMKLGDREHSVRSMEWLAGLGVAEGDHAHALELEAAASAIREKLGAPRTPLDAKRLERGLARARKHMGERAGRVEQVGRSHSLEAAAALALKRSL